MSNTHRDKFRAKQKKKLIPFDENTWRWMSTWPAAWDTIMHRRPSRRRQTAKLQKIMQGMEITEWPDYKKPHVYYW